MQLRTFNESTGSYIDVDTDEQSTRGISHPSGMNLPPAEVCKWESEEEGFDHRDVKASVNNPTVGLLSYLLAGYDPKDIAEHEGLPLWTVIQRLNEEALETGLNFLSVSQRLAITAMHFSEVEADLYKRFKQGVSTDKEQRLLIDTMSKGGDFCMRLEKMMAEMQAKFSPAEREEVKAIYGGAVEETLAELLTEDDANVFRSVLADKLVSAVRGMA